MNRLGWLSRAARSDDPAAEDMAEGYDCSINEEYIGAWQSTDT